MAEIEQLLHEHPLVSEVAIVAMPDERLGERACAFVVRDGTEAGNGERERGGAPPPGGRGRRAPPAVREFLDAREVSRHYWPERVEEIEAMPRTPSGKIQKFVLRERARELRAEDGASPTSASAKERVS